MRQKDLRLTVITLFLFLSPGLRAQELFGPQHIARLRLVNSAVISPDGTQVACVVVVPRDALQEKDGPAWTELHVTGRNGLHRPFVTGQVNVEHIAWIPDGKAISFLAKRGKDEHKSLYLIPADGGEARRLLAHESDISEYTWSPDGKRVAFLAASPPSKEEKELREKGFNQMIYEEDWRPVQVWIAEVQADNSKPQKLELEGSASSLHWSRAGSQIAVALAPTPLVDEQYTSRKVHIVDVDSGKVIQKVDNPGKLGQIAWSPDGTHLAMVSAADANDPSEGRLMVVSARGGTLQDILPDYDQGHVRSLAWPDNESLLFLAQEGVSSFLGRVRRDGSGLERIITGGTPVFDDFTLSSDGKSAALLGQSPRHPSEVFFAQPGRSQPERLTDHNPWLQEMAFAPQEVVRFTARDGLELEGLLIRPWKEEQGKRYPLILVVHGGPEAHFSNGWLTYYSQPGQVGAARGFAVFYPNYRGSTGRGVKFSKMGQADAAGKEFDDLVDGVDHLVRMGLVDGDRVGITGGSYGGYASAWGATYYSHRFAASVMFVGISDNVSKMGTTDIPHEMRLVHHRKWLWEDWNYFVERSPIYHAKKARTPILILHGKEDPRVHPGQSLELYRQLKLLGQATVRLVLYPGEGHGNRRAASRLDYSLRLLQWMEHYLKGPGGEPPPYAIDYEAVLAPEVGPDS